MKGLKPRIRKGLIISDTATDYDSTVQESTPIDSQLYYSGRHQARNNGKQRRGKDERYKSNPVKSEHFY